MTYAVCSENGKQSGSLRAYTSFTILCKNINAFSNYTFQIFFFFFSSVKFQYQKDFCGGNKCKTSQSFAKMLMHCFPLSTFQLFLLGNLIDKFQDSKECWCGFRGPARGLRIVRLLWLIRFLTKRLVRAWIPATAIAFKVILNTVEFSEVSEVNLWGYWSSLKSSKVVIITLEISCFSFSNEHSIHFQHDDKPQGSKIGNFGQCS